VTEDEAKTKVCPLIRVRKEECFGMTPRPVYDHANCVGSSCMAWVTVGTDYEYGEPLPKGNVPAAEGWVTEYEPYVNVEGHLMQRWRRKLGTTGYCVLMKKSQ
jgi:hypothetical protein